MRFSKLAVFATVVCISANVFAAMFEDLTVGKLTISGSPSSALVVITGDGSVTNTINSSGNWVLGGALSAAAYNTNGTFTAKTASIGTNSVTVQKVSGVSTNTGEATFLGGIRLSTTQVGGTYVITNKCGYAAGAYTNYIWVGSGIITNVSYVGTP